MPTSDKKVSQLPAATAIGPTDLMLIVQAGVTKSIQYNLVEGESLQSANNLSDLADAATARANLGVLSADESSELITNTFGEGEIIPGTPGVPSGTTFVNSFSSGTPAVKIKTTGFNNKMVVFQGLLNTSGVVFTPGGFIHAFTLPTAARPTIVQNFLVPGLNNAIGICAVHPDGKVYLLSGLVGSLSTAGLVDLSCVQYYK